MYENAFDPKETNPPRRYFEVSNPSVAFDRFHNAYVTYTEHRPDQSTGRLIVRKFKFEGSLIEVDMDGNPLNGLSETLYAWFDNTRAFNPNIAVDTNEGLFAGSGRPRTGGQADGRPGRVPDRREQGPRVRDLEHGDSGWPRRISRRS